MFQFLLVVHAIIAAALVAVILMQRSEGGGLGMGGSPSGLMSARGAADFLTRATTVLATLFVVMCITLATLASFRNAGAELDTSLARQPAPAQQPQLPLGSAETPVQPAPTTDPLAGAATPTAATPAPAAPRSTTPAPRTERGSTTPGNPDPVAAGTTPAAPARVAPPPVVRTSNATAPATTTAPANGSGTPNN